MSLNGTVSKEQDRNFTATCQLLETKVPKTVARYNESKHLRSSLFLTVTAEAHFIPLVSKRRMSEQEERQLSPAAFATSDSGSCTTAR
ncbi:hypothetical protein RRG08_031262 [Elysia crispata]|uniref:Uncharacterized protein n=1 Tax=Elysia crispata TaxID=231223 RepID=A0AAE1AK59_9GAST|nr:hypothetical protein RRG08_031262 [Elysia crispata]